MEKGAELGGSVPSGMAGRELVELALPILGSIVLELIEGSINVMWVGRYLGETALAAVSNANTVLFLLFSGAFGIWMALTIRIGRQLGAGRLQDARALVRAAGWAFVGVGGLLVVAFEILALPFLRELSVPTPCLLQAGQYLRVILLSVPVTYLCGMVFAVLRGAGETRPAFLFSLLVAMLDAVLNPLFIFGLGPLPSGGVSGSAWATVLAQTIGLSALLLYLYGRGHPLCLRKGEFVLQSTDWIAVGQIVKQGGPVGLEYLWYSVLAILMISLVNQFGTEVAAAYGAMIQLWNYLMMPSMAISLAATSMVARSLGAGQWEQVNTVTRLSVIYSLVTTGLLLLLLESADKFAILLFLPSSSPALIAACQINHVASWSCVLFSGWVALMGTPRAAGAVWGPLIVSVLALGSRLPIAEVLSYHWEVGGIWWSFPMSGVITAIATGIYYGRGRWRRHSLPTAIL